MAGRFRIGRNDLASLGLVDYFQPYNVSIPPTNAVLNLTVYQNGMPVSPSPSAFRRRNLGSTSTAASTSNYTVQVSTNLASTNWSTLFSLQLTNSPFFVVDPNATNSARFYRVQKSILSTVKH